MNTLCMCKGAKNYSINCPLIQETKLIVTKKWLVPLVMEISKNKSMRFLGIKKSLSPITSKILAKRLKELEHSHIIGKRSIPSHRDDTSSEYFLTDKGEDFVKYLFGLRDFSI